MKTPFFTPYLIGIILLLAMVASGAAALPTISSISPSQGFTGTTTGTITITGTNFNTTPVLVRLMKDGDSNISATISSHSTTTIKCTFTISSSKTIGTWDVVVVNTDGSEAVDPDAFTIRKTMTLTSVSPTSAQTNDDSVTVAVSGTGLSDVESMYLHNVDYDNITADITSQTSTKVVGTFDLTDANFDIYKICVADSVETIKCGLEFEIVTDEVGSIDVESTPSGAKVYIDSTYMGTTPYSSNDVTVGSHKILISYSGYVDYSKLVTVKADSTVSVSADLNSIRTTSTTSVPTVATSKTPLKATTAKVPTSWPTPAPTQASAPESTVVLGAVAFVFAVLFRK